MKNIKLKNLLKEDKPKSPTNIHVAKRDVKIPGFGPIKKGEPMIIIEKLKADDPDNTSGYDEYVIVDAFEYYSDNYYIPVDVFKSAFEVLDKNKHSKVYNKLLKLNIIKEGFLSPLDLDKIQDKMGYIKAYGKYWEIIRIYPNQKRKEVTFEGPAGLEICGFNSLSPTTETHNGKPVWRKDV